MMLLAFFRPGRHIRDTNRRNLSIIPAVIERMYHQIIGATGDDLLNSFFPLSSRKAKIRVIDRRIGQFLCHKFSKARKVGISLVYLLFFGGHESLCFGSEPITHDQCLRSCQSNDTACTIQSKGLCNPGIFPWIGSECDTSRSTYIPFLQVFLQFVICPCLFAHTSLLFAFHSSMEAQ